MHHRGRGSLLSLGFFCRRWGRSVVVVRAAEEAEATCLLLLTGFSSAVASSLLRRREEESGGGEVVVIACGAVNRVQQRASWRGMHPFPHLRPFDASIEQVVGSTYQRNPPVVPHPASGCWPMIRRPLTPDPNPPTQPPTGRERHPEHPQSQRQVPMKVAATALLFAASVVGTLGLNQGKTWPPNSSQTTRVSQLQDRMGNRDPR